MGRPSYGFARCPHRTAGRAGHPRTPHGRAVGHPPMGHKSRRLSAAGHAANFPRFKIGVSSGRTSSRGRALEARSFLKAWSWKRGKTARDLTWSLAFRRMRLAPRLCARLAPLPTTRPTPLRLLPSRGGQPEPTALPALPRVPHCGAVFAPPTTGLGYCFSGVRRPLHAGSLRRGRQGRRRSGRRTGTPFGLNLLMARSVCSTAPLRSFCALPRSKGMRGCPPSG